MAKRLAGRTVTAMSWHISVGSVTAVLLLIRTTLLTRWVSPVHFGTYTLAYAIVAGSSILANFGLAKAFLHRAPESHDEDQAAATHFTLQAAFAGIWCALLIACTLLFAEGALRTALLVITPAVFGILLTETPRYVLIRRVVHRRLAILAFSNIILTTGVALPLAWQGAGLWALLVTDVVSLMVHVIVLFGWRPVWKPRLGWSPRSVRYFLRFGSKNMLADLSAQLIDRLDDIWTGVYLGSTPLGYYSRAYAFAGHPRRLLSGPIQAVAGGTYAELKGDRARLSQAFFRVNAMLVRAGFLVAGMLYLIMPEFIHLFLTETWRSILPAFRLLLIFMLLDPIRRTVADLYVAVGRPGRIVQAYAIQLVVLLTGLYALGSLWGIAGVAIAVDVMLVAGVAFLLRGARRYVDYSLRRLLLIPALALACAIAIPYLAFWLSGAPDNPWLSALSKLLLSGGAYLSVLLPLERNEARRMLSAIRGALGREDVQGSVVE